MKRAIGLIAATLLTTSVYSQDYSSSPAQEPDSTPADYDSRQSEAGAPATSESSSSSTSGYETSPGTSGGNSLTGQSSGANIDVQGDQGEDKTLTTRDSDVSGSEYRGTVESEPQQSFDSELSTESTASGSSGSSVSESESSEIEPLRGSGTADGAFHEPATPVREGSESEGWSGAGTFSGAGPGSVSDSDSSSNYSSSPSTIESTSDFEAEVSGNAALSERDEDLSSRGLEPDSEQLSRDDSFSNRVEGDLEGDMDRDSVLIFEDWTIVEPDTNVGGPAGSDSGSSSSDADNRDQSDAEMSSDSYDQELYQRVQRDWSARIGNTDVPATPSIMDHELDHLRFYNSDRSNDVGAPGRNESGVKSSDDDMECDTNKNKGSSAEFEEGELDGSVSSDYHINRGEDETYHINRSESSSSSESTGAPGEYGDRATSSNYDDGHLSGNNAAGSSAESERDSDSSENSTPSSEEGALNQPDL